jgi:hypothetical protein
VLVGDVQRVRQQLRRPSLDVAAGAGGVRAVDAAVGAGHDQEGCRHRLPRRPERAWPTLLRVPCARVLVCEFIRVSSRVRRRLSHVLSPFSAAARVLFLHQRATAGPLHAHHCLLTPYAMQRAAAHTWCMNGHGSSGGGPATALVPTASADADSECPPSLPVQSSHAAPRCAWHRIMCVAAPPPAALPPTRPNVNAAPSTSISSVRPPPFVSGEG